MRGYYEWLYKRLSKSGHHFHGSSDQLYRFIHRPRGAFSIVVTSWLLTWNISINQTFWWFLRIKISRATLVLYVSSHIDPYCISPFTVAQFAWWLLRCLNVPQMHISMHLRCHRHTIYLMYLRVSFALISTSWPHWSPRFIVVSLPLST
jgi:hypothetical protein